MSYSRQTCPAVLGKREKDLETLVIVWPACEESCFAWDSKLAAAVGDAFRGAALLELGAANPWPAPALFWPPVVGAGLKRLAGGANPGDEIERKLDGLVPESLAGLTALKPLPVPPVSSPCLG